MKPHEIEKVADWRPPETEAAWAELLSACLDGEISPEENRALAAHLETDPLHARQFEELRKLSNELQTRGISAIESESDSAPDPAWLDALLETAASARVVPASADWIRLAATFVLGAALGALTLFGAQRGSAISQSGGERFASQPLTLPNIPSTSPVSAESAISSAQANDIAREIQADAVRAAMLRQFRAGDWVTARRSFDKLREQYSGTRALAELRTLNTPKWIADRANAPATGNSTHSNRNEGI